MKQSIDLSIILTTHTKSEHFHALLADVLSIRKKKLEIIIIDDSNDLVTSQFIEREINQSENERVYLFTHERIAGRGKSLNEAILHASGSLIWAPLRADRLNESLMDEAIRRFNSDPAAFWVMDYNLPVTPMDWINAADEGDLPDDSAIVWNKSVISEEELFFNPFLDQLHGAELLFRLKNGNVWHKTDPFFVLADGQSPHAGMNDIQEFLYTALRVSDEKSIREMLLNELEGIESRIKNRVSDDEYLKQARQSLQQFDANKALEIINRFLKRNPEHQEAIRIKITSLEKLRRHVEAAELKHNLQKQPQESADTKINSEPQNAEYHPDPGTEQPAKQSDIHVSVVLPTTGHGKHLLEAALLDLQAAADEAVTELIVVDNASIDDTFDYLEQLQESDFMNIRVITNPVNAGFAASVNQGLEAARGEYVLVMHNDTRLPAGSVQELQKTFAMSDDIGIAAPAVRSTKIKAQDPDTDIQETYVLAERADSCCFMIKKEIPVRFDEDFGLCFFEMDDFCRQITHHQLKIIICRDMIAEHHSGTTIRMMGFDLNPELKWENRARYYHKWNPDIQYKIPVQGTHPEKFLYLGAPYNPMKPETEWVNVVQNYLTSEIRTEILRKEWNQDEMLTIILTLLIADERELLRTLEDKMNGLQPDSSLLIMFVCYYFRKNIYSRCKHYMDLAENPHPVFDLFRLKILIAEKEIDEAGMLLNKLLERYPSSPELYSLAAKMYRDNGEENEANSFYSLACQLDPIRFKKEGSAFDLSV